MILLCWVTMRTKSSWLNLGYVMARIQYGYMQQCQHKTLGGACWMVCVWGGGGAGGGDKTS